MGYRSSVSITLVTADFERLMFCAEAQDGHVADFLNIAEFYRNELFTTLCFDWVKWYVSDEDVRFIETFLADVPHMFWRLGEENCDIEYRSNLDGVDFYKMYSCVNFVRKLDFSGAGEKIDVGLRTATF